MDFLPFVGIFLIFAAILFLVFRNYFRKVTIPLVLPQEGFSVPVVNSARGTFWFHTRNGAWPQFKLYEDHFTVLVLGKISKSYNQISGIKESKIIFPFLTISFADEPWKIYLTMNKYNLDQVVAFLNQKINLK